MPWMCRLHVSPVSIFYGFSCRYICHIDALSPMDCLGFASPNFSELKPRFQMGRFVGVFFFKHGFLEFRTRCSQ